MDRARLWVVTAMAAAALAAPAAAQDWKGIGRFEGRVVDADGKPIEGATVKLDLPERGGGTSVKTDKKGKWAIGGIAAGQWNVDVEAAGYAPKFGLYAFDPVTLRRTPRRSARLFGAIARHNAVPASP